jgi:SAM-dependent methyltransferase
MTLAQHQQKYNAAIRQARQTGEQAFHAWFNREATQTVRQGIVRGAWDWSVHILTPTVCQYITTPETKVALEIGYGGGRLLHAASDYFREVIGIDIHDEYDAVAAFLRQQNKHNVRLIRTCGDTIDVADASIDFVYSFIVLQHLPSFVTFARYLGEVYRCLTMGGVAQLYFGAFARLHPLYRVWYSARGYREKRHAPANHISLMIRTTRVRRLCRALGFRVVASGTSFYRVPDGYPAWRGGQSFVTLVKDETTSAFALQ